MNGVIPVVLLCDLTNNSTVEDVDDRVSTFARVDDVYQGSQELFGSRAVIVVQGSASEPWLLIA